MVFIMPSCKNWLEFVRVGLLSCCLMFLGGFAWAGNIEIRNPQLLAYEDGYALSADFSIDFSSRLEEAIEKGITLYFVLDFELERPRWYWMDDKVSTRSQVWRLSYHALTRQYRLSSGALHQSFESLDSALRMLSRVRNWVVVEEALKPGDTYEAALRMRLDISQLPKPFQVSALTSREWNLNSDWLRWKFVVPQPGKSVEPPAPVPTPAPAREAVLPEPDSK